MDALLINIASNGPGQLSVAPGESVPEDRETAFAETLSAAMAASMQGTVTTEQEASERPVDGGDGPLLAALHGSTNLNAVPDLAVDADRPTASKTSADGGEAESLGPRVPSGPLADRTTPLNPPSTPARQVPGVNESLGGESDDAVNAVDAEDQWVTSAASESNTQRSLGGLERQSQSTVRPIETPTAGSSTKSAEDTPDIGVPAATISQRRSVDLDQFAEASPEPSTRLASTRGELPLTSTGVGRRILESSAESGGAHQANVQTARTSLADNVVRGPQSAVALLGGAAATQPDHSVTLREVASAPNGPPSPSQTALPQTDLVGQPGLASLLQSRPDVQMPVQRSSSNQRPSQPLVDGVVPPKVADETGVHAPQERSQNDPSLDLRASRGLTSAGDSVQPPTAQLLQSASPDQALATTQAVSVDGVDLPTSDRFQSLFTADGFSPNGDRFELANTVGSTRSSSIAAPTLPSAQIGLQIARSIANGVERLTVHLHPAELGSVDIQLNFDDTGRLSAQIIAERPETLELLQRDSRLLERSLGDNGLKFTNDGLSFSLKQDQQQQQAGQQFQQQADTRQAAVQAGRAYDETLNTEDQSPIRHRDGLRLLDIET